jgi:hypothetical protein
MECQLMSELFPEEILNDPERAAGFCASLGYDSADVAEMLVARFGLDRDSAVQLSDRAAQAAAAREERERAELDRIAIEAEHRIDPWRS